MKQDIHPLGEPEKERRMLAMAVGTAMQVQAQEADMRVATPGGCFHVHWDEQGSATALGQLAFFAEFLEVSGLFERWRDLCPLAYTSPNAPKVEDVLGTWLLSILDGQRRYAHVIGLRGDGVAPQMLGMTRIMSDESLRRALAALAPKLSAKCSPEEGERRQAQLAQSTAWMDQALKESLDGALNTPWVLDVDSSVKLIYGHQAGAEVGYNPRKPGRPSHTLHTYWMGNLRLVLDVELQGGKTHAAKYSLPRLCDLIRELPQEQRPALVRGDSAFGNEPVMGELERLEQSYLFKIRQSAGIKRLIERLWSRRGWIPVSQGFDALEAEAKLSGWGQARRIIVLRRRARGNLVAQKKSGESQTLLFGKRPAQTHPGCIAMIA